MAGTGFPIVVANRAQMCTADCHEENNLTEDCYEENSRTTDCYKDNNRTADCHSQEYKFESGLPRGKPRYTSERFAKGLFLSWQTAVCERGLPQKSEIQYQPFYIDSPHVRGDVSF
jgi:hypothetical protein